jgi:hypothetical protein
MDGENYIHIGRTKVCVCVFVFVGGWMVEIKKLIACLHFLLYSRLHRFRRLHRPMLQSLRHYLWPHLWMTANIEPAHMMEGGKVKYIECSINNQYIYKCLNNICGYVMMVTAEMYSQVSSNRSQSNDTYHNLVYPLYGYWQIQRHACQHTSIRQPNCDIVWAYKTPECRSLVHKFQRDRHLDDA